MNARMLSARRINRLLCSLTAVVISTSPSAAVLAQTSAAQQAVRQRAQGIGQPVEYDGRPSDVVQSPNAFQRTGGDTTLLADPAAGKIDSTYVSPGSAAVVVLRPAQLMTSPVTEMLPREVATAAGLKFLGFDPAEVEEAIAFVDVSDPKGLPAYGLTLKFKNGFRAASIPQESRAHAQLGELNGKKYLQSQHPILPSFYGANNRTLVMAPDTMLRQMVEAKGQGLSGPMIDRLRNVPSGSDAYLAIDVASLRPLPRFQMLLGQARMQAPQDAKPFLNAVDQISAAELTFNITSSGPMSLVVHGNDEAAAQQLETLLSDAVRKHQEEMKTQFAQMATSEDPIERAVAQYAERVSGQWSQPLMPTREGASLTFFRDITGGEHKQLLTATVIRMLAGGLSPALIGARQAAGRNESANHLKEIMLALHVHHDSKGSFPAHASYSADGKPLMSWRVHILPFLEQQALYDQFHLDEPWDSEHNRTLIAQMPGVYRCPDAALEPGKTNYLAVVGEQCALNGTKDGLRLHDITDGTSKTIAIVEADVDQAVEWTKPDDWEFAAENPTAGLGKLRGGVWNAAYCDGSVRPISNNIDVETIKALFTRAGGEVIPNF